MLKCVKCSLRAFWDPLWVKLLFTPLYDFTLRGPWEQKVKGIPFGMVGLKWPRAPTAQSSHSELVSARPVDTEMTRTFNLGRDFEKCLYGKFMTLLINRSAMWCDEPHRKIVVNTFPEDFLLIFCLIWWDRRHCNFLSAWINRSVSQGKHWIKTFRASLRRLTVRGVPPLRSLTEVEDIGRPETWHCYFSLSYFVKHLPGCLSDKIAHVFVHRALAQDPSSWQAALWTTGTFTRHEYYIVCLHCRIGPPITRLNKTACIDLSNCTNTKNKTNLHFIPLSCLV